MENVVEVIARVEDNKMVTNSRNIADVFGKRHDNVLRDIEALKKDILNFEEMFTEDTLPDTYGRKQKVYFINRDGFSLLAMGFTGSEATKWKLKYIEAFNKMETIVNSPEQVMARALKVADRTISETKERIKLLEEKIEEDKAHVNYVKVITASNDCILVRELAKLITQSGVPIGEIRLFTFLRDNHYLISSGADRNRPTQKYMEMGLFKVIEMPVCFGKEVKIKFTTKVTPKGQEYFINKFMQMFSVKA